MVQQGSFVLNPLTVCSDWQDELVRNYLYSVINIEFSEPGDVVFMEHLILRSSQQKM